MDPSKFDDMTKYLVESTSRRTALRFLLGSTLGAALPLIRLRDGEARATREPRERRKLSARCRRNEHCPGGVCQSGRCRCLDDRQPCGGRICCGEFEVCQELADGETFCLDLRK